MPSYPAYIPARDADFDAWVTNFSARATATPTDYGLTAPIAVTIAAVVATWTAAYPLSQNPATRTPSTIAAKDAARANAEFVIRPYAVRVSLDDAVTNAAKTDIGVTVRSTVPTPIPAPVDPPEIALVSMIPLQATLSSKVPGSTGKSKPFGSIGVEIAQAVGVAHTVDPAAAAIIKTVTKSPFRLTFSAPQQGQHLTIFARFVTRSGPAGEAQRGPWSSPLQTFVV